MPSSNKYESQASMRRRTIQYSFTPSLHHIQRKELTRKEGAARDLFVILHTIQKRKEFRVLEQIHFSSQSFQRKQISTKQTQYQERTSKSKQKDRSKSVGLYAGYSRARLLREIVGKLKAKHEIADLMGQDQIASQARIVRLEKMLEEAYEHNTSMSKEANEGGIKMAELMKQTVDRKQKQQKSNFTNTEQYGSTWGLAQRSKHTQFQNSQAILAQQQRQNATKMNQSQHYEHFHRYQVHNNQAFANHNNYERVRHFVSPIHHQFSAPMVPIRASVQKPYSEMLQYQTQILSKKVQMLSSKDYQTSSQKTAVSPRNAKGINVISQLPFKKIFQRNSEYVATKSASHFVEPFQQRNQPSLKGNYCDRCGRYCRCHPE